MENRERVIEALMGEVRRTGRYPDSAAGFCEGIGVGEREFFEMFPNFEAVESAYWGGVVERVIGRVQEGEEWEGFTARQRLLTFLFAFVEDAMGYRSLLLSRFGQLRPFERPVWLGRFEGRFTGFADDVVGRGIDTGEIADRGYLVRLYPRAMYLHFRSVIAFTLEDDSAGFERTDAFIEKTVHLAFDVVRSQAVDSAFDLARFLIPGVMRR